LGSIFTPLFIFINVIIKNVIKKILKEWIHEESVPFQTEAYFDPVVTWYISPHAMDRMSDDRNISNVSEKEVKDLCQRATSQMIKIFADKRNNFKPGPGFKFQILDKQNEYLNLGCLIERHETLSELEITISTVLKSGSRLRLGGYVATYEPKLFTIEV